MRAAVKGLIRGERETMEMLRWPYRKLHSSSGWSPSHERATYPQPICGAGMNRRAGPRGAAKDALHTASHYAVTYIK